jgi:hypothetical protein
MSSAQEEPGAGRPGAAPCVPAGGVPAQRVPTARLEARLAALLPPAPALDLATVTSGLCDGPARESVARLLAG